MYVRIERDLTLSPGSSHGRDVVRDTVKAFQMTSPHFFPDASAELYWACASTGDPTGEGRSDVSRFSNRL